MRDVPLKRLGEYIIETLIGEGAMGCVYRAVDTRTQTPVAIKIPHFDSDEDRENVLNEVQLCTQLEHPAIVRVYEVREFDGDLAIVMELVEGRSLGQMLQEQGRLDTEQTLDIATQVASALGVAHAQNILHRDIKPDNVMVSPDDSVRVMDFGIAERVDPDRLSVSQRIAGTAMYMSPEQAMGAPLDARSDLYSLGAMMYEMVTGHPPFEGGNLISLLYRHINEAPLPPRRENPELTPDLNRIILRLLRKEPSERYASARELANQLNMCRQSAQDAGALPMPTVLDEVEEAWQSTDRFEAAFVGREAELARLTSAYQQAREGKGSSLLIEGEQGIGKSRLAEEFVRELPGAAILRGRCVESGVSAPYLPFVQALSTHFAEGLPDRLSELLQAHGRSDADFDAEAAHQDLLETLTETFLDIAKDRPTCLVLEDIQYCDSGSLEALSHLLPRLHESALLVLVNHTLGEANSIQSAQQTRLEQVLAKLESDGLIEQLILPRLGQPQIAQLIDSLFELADFDPTFAEHLYRETQGNPLFVLETLEWLRAEEVVIADPLGVWSLTQSPEMIEIPEHVTALLRQRLNGLPSDLRELLRCASVSEDEQFDLRMLSVLMQASGLELLDMLGALERTHRLIVPIGTRYRLDHAKLKQLLYEELSREERRDYHLTLARAWESQENADIYTLAHHYERAAEPRKAREYLLKAARSDEQLYANDRAVEYYRRVLQFTDPQEPEYLDVLQRVAWIQSHLLGEVEHSIEAYEKIGELAQQRGELTQQAEAIKQLGNLHAVRGEWPASERAYQQSRSLFEQLGDQHQVGNIWMNLGLNQFETGNVEDSEACFKHASEIATQTDSMELQADADRGFGMIYALQQNTEQAVHYYRSSIQGYQKLGALRYLAQTQMHLGMVYSGMDDLERADRYYADSEESARRTGDVRFLGFVCLNRAELLSRTQPDRARELCNEALTLLRKADDRAGVLAAYRIFGQIYAVLGQWELAKRCVNTSIELAEQGNNQLDIADGYRELGNILLQSGDPAEARSALEQASERYLELGAEEQLKEIQKMLSEAD